MEKYKQHLESLRQSGNLRQLRDITLHAERIGFQGNDMVNLSSNDYLGLGADQTLWQEFLQTEAQTENGFFPGSACSSRLLTGNHSAYQELEETLATLYKTEAALVFNSGYHANMGILPALAGSKDLILADKLVHASIIDGIRLSAAKCIRFPHNDLERLEKILVKERNEYEHVFIVTESIFSMDGDLADLQRLVEIKERYNALLYVDEAHALGVRGETGLGCIEEFGLLGKIDLLVGTFGKAIASQGAFVACNQILKEYLVNTMRTLIFTTGLPPWSVKWTNFVMQRLTAMKNERAHLSEISNALRETILACGLETAGESNIVPIIIRDMSKTLQLSKYLCKQGFFVLPIRPPTVPAGTERLRISLTAAISNEQIHQFSEILCKHIGK
ncbi:aminotransferase class I/II-fold pyridoxal phosphate-dependent enzyme [Parabacteroides sp. FAFU027]|uniref:aminotransferase class I/II-fold pyridoxal phosphate-dependent enzyme n=1 Tax=Parabacteroides sp. FAFU027 TaxID=2922715 RepID=UPI00397DAC49